MNRLLNVIRKLLLTANWLFFGTLSAIAFISSYNINDTNNSNEAPKIESEWWYPYLYAFSENIDVTLLTWVGIGCLVIGFIVHVLVQWIFA